MNSSSLVVLGCSGTKFNVKGSVPALHVYDGPMYRVLRSHLRNFQWPSDLSVSVLSARYGLIGALAPIQKYERRMTVARADSLRGKVNETLTTLANSHQQVQVVLGKDYLQTIDSATLGPSEKVRYAPGPIGMKLHYLSDFLKGLNSVPRKAPSVSVEEVGRPLYFLPDWDDFLDEDFDFANDAFSSPLRKDRQEVHIIEAMHPKRICDGVLVSLAQHLGGGKGLLKRAPLDDPDMMRPISIRQYFGLADDQWVFGDCGAFSYVNEDNPAVSVEQAVAIYDLYDFDFGASVDHIPVPELFADGKRRSLSEGERKRRIRITHNNAERFLSVWKERGGSFIPVGVIQGIDADGYASQVNEYLEMGYQHLALGGLVPRTDEDIDKIVRQVTSTISKLKSRPWIHLLGVFRPKLQGHFRESQVSSFDSATYFRKAWLRSDQNYLGCDGNWYAAIRVPPTSDARTLQRLRKSGKSEAAIKKLEKEALTALREYSTGSLEIDGCLQAVLKYDRLLDRGEYSSGPLKDHYRRTLQSRPWQNCDCAVCQQLGIEVALFRGYNRNKRRGAHNTLRLYNQLKETPTAARTAVN